MELPDRLRHFLAEHSIDYTCVLHSPVRRIQRAAALAGIDAGCVARGVLVRAGGGRPHLVVLPADRLLSFSRLDDRLGDSVEIVPAVETARFFSGCAMRTTPAVGPAWGVPTLIDRALYDRDTVFLAAGCPDRLVAVRRESFDRLFADCGDGGFSENDPDIGAETMLAREAEGAEVPYVASLPPMPGIALQLLELSREPTSTVDDIARLVEQDPSLAAQVVRYARSPFFGVGRDIETVRDAVLRVLGSDLVVNLALGLAAGRAFSIPRQGALGLSAFWQHATYTAWLVQDLVRHMPAETRPSPGLAYLSALVHNIGFLILGQLFRPEFEMLNRLIAVNPRTRVSDVERQVLALGEARRVVALGHDRLGARLLKSWDLPTAAVAAAAHHHDPGYDGPHSNIVLLILVADRLTRRIALGDGDSGHVPDSVLASLGLSNEDVERVCLRLVDAREGLDDLALQLAA